MTRTRSKKLCRRARAHGAAPCWITPCYCSSKAPHIRPTRSTLMQRLRSPHQLPCPQGPHACQCVPMAPRTRAQPNAWPHKAQKHALTGPVDDVPVHRRPWSHLPQHVQPVGPLAASNPSRLLTHNSSQGTQTRRANTAAMLAYLRPPLATATLQAHPLPQLPASNSTQHTAAIGLPTAPPPGVAVSRHQVRTSALCCVSCC